MSQSVSEAAYAGFRADLEARPAMSLRAGEAVDAYREPPPFDPVLDEPTDDYLAAYAFEGILYLDAASWRHYLPLLIDYSLRHMHSSPSLAIEGLLWSLRPPERDLALQVLEEWWMPGALYRP